ncbi:MAG: DNA polymerase IV, partial [Actinomycetes bacterium]
MWAEPGPTPARTVLHVDMDAFFVSCELLRRPELRGRPVVVGGSGDRGVVAAASYEARAYGVHSALSSAVARRRCPDAVFVHGDHAYYSKVSGRIMDLFRSVTPLVEPLSLDEAVLDVTGARRLLGEGARIAAELRARVLDEVGLTCSVGVAPSKFLAKLASEEAKPTATPSGPVFGPGVFEVRPGEELAFLHPLDVSALWGVGPKTLAKLRNLGVTTVGDLAALPQEPLVAALGRGSGEHLWALAHAVDDRPVVPDQAAKSVSHEVTFPVDLTDPEELHRELVRLADSVAARLRRAGLRSRTISVKVRYPDRETVTRSRTLEQSTDRSRAVVAVADELLLSLPVHRGVRLLGVAAGNFTEGSEQLSLDLFGTGAERGAAGDDEGGAD